MITAAQTFLDPGLWRRHESDSMSPPTGDGSMQPWNARRLLADSQDCGKFSSPKNTGAFAPFPALATDSQTANLSAQGSPHAARIPGVNHAKRPIVRVMHSANPSLRRDQLDAALEGDSDALDQVIDHLTPVIQARLTRLLLRRTAGHPSGEDRKELEDLVQDVFLHLFADGAKVLRRWDPERGASLQNFVGLVTERYAISVLRKRHRLLPTDSLDPERPDPVSEETDPEGWVASRQVLSQLLDGLQTALSPQGWTVFRLLFVEERSVSDIQEQEGLSTDAIYAWRSRLRKLARRLWDDMDQPSNSLTSNGLTAAPRTPR